MVFSTITFLFIFLPLFLVSYVLLPWRNIIIIAFSLLFYTWGEGPYVVLLLGTVLVNYLFGIGIARRPDARWPLIAGVTVNLVILIYFKYFYFLVSDVLKLSALSVHAPHLPLGISFFIFQSISYLVDVYRGESKHAESYMDLAVYITMFPQLIAGPIVRYSSVSKSIRKRVVHANNVYRGTGLFITGLCQKVLIANNVAEIADSVFAVKLGQLNIITAWVGAVAYSLQIYFDFAGYSLMAIGIGYILGFEFPQNFNYPYISTSITEFWRRWHISLSTWFRDYLYIPLGGNRKGPVRTYVNLFIVFFLCGLWHGAAWTFVVWGMFHGFLLVIERIGLGKILKQLPKPVSWLYAMLFVIIGWVIFRAENFSQAYDFLSAMAGGGTNINTSQYIEIVTNENLFFYFLGIIFSFPVMPSIYARLKGSFVLTINDITVNVKPAMMVMYDIFGFGLCMIYILSGTYNPFIYFRF